LEILAAGIGTLTYQSSGGEMNILRAGLADSKNKDSIFLIQCLT
jgi:hypothetical protein